ncbi:MAG: ATP-binding protein, partial [Paracoccaceae bacterium]|nr:ATP-binding protein [Paracoccaceae bacterium]
AGKSTLAAKLAEPAGTLLIAEDDWLAALYSDEMTTPKDYVRCAAKLLNIMAPHIVSVLNTGVSVVLDFQANTIESRQWMRDIVDLAHAEHQLHVLAPPDEVCLERLRKRNADGDHAFSVSEEHFHQVTKYFTPPTPDEGFNLVFHDER